MGSCENSVIVDEPLRLSISGQHLCSELSHTLVDSKMDLASASNRCPDLVSNYNSGSLSSGRITQPCSVKGDGLLGEHKDVNGLGLESLLKDDSGRVGGCTDESCGDVDVFENEIGGECLEEGSFVSREGLVAECEAEAVDVFSLRNLLKNDSGLSRVCLNESHNDIDVREKESGGKCLQEGSFVSRDGSVGKCEAVDVLPVENLLENDSVVSGGCLVEGHNDIDASAKESDEGCLQEDNSVSRDGLGAHYEAVNVLGLSKLLKNDSVVTGGFVEENCIDVDVNENERGGKCLQECSSVGKDGLVGEYEADDVLPLENLLGHDSGHGGVCLDEKHNDIGVLEKESHGECLHEGTSVSKDGSGSEYEAMDILGSDKSLNDSAVSRGCLDENHIDFDASEKESSGEGLREGSSSSRDGLVGEYEAVDVLPLNLLTRVSVYCLDENHSDIDVHEKVNKGKCLEEGSHDDITQMCTIDGDGSVNNHKDLDVLELDNLLKNDPDVSGGYLDENHGVINVCNAEGCGESFQEGTSRDEDELGNLKVDSDIHSKVITVADLPTSCVLVDEQKDEKSVCCLFAEKIIGVREDKDDNLAKVSNDLCEQEPPSQDCESSELVPENDLMDNTLEQKEQNFKGDGDPTLGSITGKSVASVGLEADMCNGISDFLQCVELSLEASHSGEEVSSAACKIDQNNSSGCLSIERITEAVGMGSSIDTSNRVILSTSLENVLRYEQMDEKSVDSPSTKGVTEFVQEKNDVTLDTKVDVGTQILALGEIERNDISGSLKYCQPLGLVDDGFSKTLDVPDQLGNSSHGPLESSSTVDCSGKTTDQGNDNEGINCVSEAKCRDIASSSFQRNSRRSRSNRKTQIKNATRKSKKTAKALCSNGFVKVTFKARKKRSCLSKSARSSAWGLLGNVTQLFEHSNRLEVIQVPKQGSRKPKGGKKSGKQNKNGANIRSQGSRSKSSALNTKIRLKVKLGKGVNQTILNVTVPNVVDNSALPTAVSCDDGTKLGTSAPKAANGEIDDCRKCEVSMHFTCSSSNKEKAMSFPHASVQDAQLVNNDLDTHVLPEKSAQDVKDDCFGICSNVLVEASEGAAESRCKDPGTSPDSEVINLIPDAHVDSRPHDDFHATVTSPKDLAVPADLTSNNRRRKKNKCSGLVNSTEDKLPLPVKINKGKPLKQYGRKQNSNNGICTGENLTSSTSAKALSNSSGDKELSVVEPLLSSVETALRVSTEALKVETGAEANGIGLSKSQKSENFLSPPKTNSRKNPKGKSQGSDSGNKRVNSRSKKQAWCTSVGKKKANETSVCDQVACNVESHPKAENHMVDGKGKANSGENIASSDVSNLEVSPAALGEQYLPPRNAWVRCDSCHKWRRIPAELADSIEETQCSWTCKDNVDKAFADCSAPQEKSNADINAELELSDASGEEDASGTRLTYKGLEYRRLRDLRETPTCISIRTNQYLHRSRKTQTIDEIMVCHCKPPSDGRLGCGDDCLNRMLNIECVQGACPCRDLCSNQQFQKRKYAKLGKFQCGKKGCGLRLLEDISQGKFLIEYVGEVLDMQAYDARQKDYALKGHKHFYFMTLNGSEVIDACIKGNKGRFINHSCDPNCRTEKWMVNGEICIGLFALRDIKKGEEVTFDYNYVRVFGAAAKRCYCGSPQCRGYIGGDPLNGDVIIQSDSDEDYPEPMMLPVIGNAEGRLNKIVLKPSSSVIKKTSESTLDHIDEKDKQTPASVQSELSTGKENSIDHSVSAVSHVHDALELNSMGILSSSVQPLEISQQTEDVSSELISTVQQESSMEEETMEKTPSSSDRLDLTPPVEVGKSLSDSADGKRKSKSDMADDQQLSSKAHLKVKTSHSSSIVKRGKIWSDPPNTSKLQMAANKLQVLHIKPKNVIRGSFGNNFEAVEEKLNELLDADGGISKRKDAAKGYLKLLLLTAASGDSASGEAIQRNRDLSMILDALLKTKSRVVLVDIINKNGLRMLHNIMKQYRRDFKKIPILRKLLKVLEYLAAREILTSEHIHGGPPCPGMESFRESILSLTEHNDRQVHQIARNFRDRWIRRNLRKHGFVDRDDNKVEYLGSSNCNRYSATQNNRSDPCGRPSETIDFIKQSTPPTTLVGESTREGSSASCAGVSPPSGTKTRKRKSRWDQPAEAYSVLISLQHKEQKIESKQFESIVNHREKVNGEESTCLGSVNDSCQVDQAAHEGKENVLEDVPPGFASPLKPVPCSSVTSSTAFHSKCPFETVIGHPQEKFISRLPVSYGIPLSIMQQFGTPHAETAGSWAVAPGLPFHPFPPLPSYPRGKKDKLPSDDVNRLSVNQSAEDAQPDGHLPATSNLNDCTPNTSGDQPAAEILCANNRHTLKRDRETSHDLGRRYFKQHKWNNTKSWPPWHVRRNGWRCMGNLKDGTSSASIGNITNEHRSTYCSEDLNCTVEKAGNNCFQNPEHHSQH